MAICDSNTAFQDQDFNLYLKHDVDIPPCSVKFSSISSSLRSKPPTSSPRSGLLNAECRTGAEVEKEEEEDKLVRERRGLATKL